MKKIWILYLIPLLIFSGPYIASKINNYIAEHAEVKPLLSMKLQKRALKAGFASNPTNFQELLELYPDHMRPTPELIKLGKTLFFDPTLSKENSISCAGCHAIEDGGDDNRPTAIGYHGRANPFHLNSPTVLNAALEKFQFWNARVTTLEEQAEGPMTAPFEMAMTPEAILEKLKKSPYKEQFAKIFPDGLTWKNLTKAIAAYERTLLTRSRFDDFLDGNLSALNEKEQKGLQLFMDVGCTACHFGRSIGGQIIQKFPMNSYSNFFYPEFGFKNRHYIYRQIVFQKPKTSYFPFKNVGGFLGKDDALRFKVPILREIARTAPYFHNGSIDDLNKVVEIMAKYQRGIQLTKNQIEEIVAFLKSLSGKPINYEF